MGSHVIGFFLVKIVLVFFYTSEMIGGDVIGTFLFWHITEDLNNIRF